MAKITLNWRDDDDSALSFTADLSAVGAEAQAIRQSFRQAGFKQGKRDRSLWIVADRTDEAEQLFRQIERQHGHRIEHSGDSYAIRERIARNERNPVPIYDRERRETPHDILWSWSQGDINGVTACNELHCSLAELHQAADDNDVPRPTPRGTPPTGSHQRPKP